MAKPRSKGAARQAGKGLRTDKTDDSAVTNSVQVYKYIKERILSLEFPPGMNLAQVDFGHLAVSRTPVREALIKLAHEGLVTLHQNRGAWVSEITLSDVRQFFEALDVAQRMVTRLAALRAHPSAFPLLKRYAEEFDDFRKARDVSGMHEANFKLHQAIAETCGNVFVAEYYVRLLTIGMRVSLLALTYERNFEFKGKLGLENISDEHDRMLACIMSGDADKAEQVALEHTAHARDRVMGYLHSAAESTVKISPESGEVGRRTKRVEAV
jgi:DNA-binding GntR family transcriptional regulator